LGLAVVSGRRCYERLLSTQKSKTEATIGLPRNILFFFAQQKDRVKALEIRMASRQVHFSQAEYGVTQLTFCFLFFFVLELV
jgi:hypothetical protein